MDPLMGTKATVSVRIGDRDYRMSPLSDADGDELNEYVAGVLVRRALAAVRDLPGAEWERAVGAAMREAASMSYSDPTGWRIMYTPSGLSRLFLQGIKRNHPDATHEGLRDALNASPGQLREVMEQFKRVNVPPSRGGESGGGRPLAEPTSTAPS